MHLFLHRWAKISKICSLFIVTVRIGHQYNIWFWINFKNKVLLNLFFIQFINIYETVNICPRHINNHNNILTLQHSQQFIDLYNIKTTEFKVESTEY